jgi:dienelactone hydrolase
MLGRTWVIAFAILAGCTSNGQKIDELAARAHLNRHQIRIGEFATVFYVKQSRSQADETFAIFLEGDGVPWLHGMTPNVDPTTREPLALKLLADSDLAGAYVARPCYQEIQTRGCTPDLWTSGRYSQAVVDTLVSAIEHVLQRTRARHVALIGYSGGGVLAVLVAERVPRIAAVITLAANLDTDAWTAYHHYLPLGHSLNPARSEQAHAFREIHLIGRLDTVVPPQTRSAYFARYPAAQQIVLDNYTHVCCWLNDWPALTERIDSELGSAFLHAH